MHKILSITVVLFFLALIALGQENKITVPRYNDRYSKYVEQLESGQSEIDYTDFRNSFLESGKSTNLDHHSPCKFKRKSDWRSGVSIARISKYT